LAGFIALLVISKNRVRIFMSTAVPVILMVTAFFLFAPQDLKDYALTRVRALTGEDSDRVDVAVDHFSRGLAAFKEHPVLGVGFGAFSDTRFGELTESISHEQHSGYVAILAETGVVGFGLMLCLHLIVLGQLIRLWRIAPGRYRELAMYLVVVLIALGVSEVYNRIWRERAMWIIVGMIAALPYVSIREQLRDRVTRLNSRFQWSGLGRVTFPPHGIN
jgi:O-antigen ligase